MCGLEPISVGGAKAGKIGKSLPYWDRLLGERQENLSLHSPTLRVGEPPGTRLGEVGSIVSAASEGLSDLIRALGWENQKTMAQEVGGEGGSPGAAAPARPCPVSRPLPRSLSWPVSRPLATSSVVG